MILLDILFWVSVLLVLHVYVGYPVGIYLRSKLHPKAVPPKEVAGGELPYVTVLIPAHNEERWIACKIENTLALEYPSDRLQVLVASDGSTDNTMDIAARYVGRGVEVNHRAERCGKTATLNRVVPKVRGEIVLISDCNALLPVNTLQLLVLHFQDPSVGCVTGEKVCLPTDSSASEGEGLYWRYEAWIKNSESALGSCLGSNGQVMAIRKKLFTPIPVVGDDFYIPMQILISAGAQVRFEPRAKASIPAAANLGLELRRKERSHASLLLDLPYLKGGLNPLTSRIWWRFLSHHVLRLFVPFALLIALASSTLLWRFMPLYGLIAVCQASFYGAAITGYLFARRGWRPRIVYLPFYFVFANLGVFLAWIRWARGKHQYAWQRTDRIMPTAGPATPSTEWGK
ncbi:MAG TPA: glycosyltransferase [Terriglobia bacterium]|nr:glycosyltransferase [Terriglobia bacterium]